jgi:cell pole-organizing protein PopZ
MSQLAKAQEPTMEEILASIRRIIADDDATKSAPGPVKQFAPPAAVPSPSPTPATAATNNQDDMDAMLAGYDSEAKNAAPAAPDVLELTEAMQSNAAAFSTIDGPPDVVFSEAPEADEPSAEAPRAVAAMPYPDRPLVSPRTAAVVDMAFNSLAHTVLVQNSRTLEDLVREMLKPMLKAWLDDNLPNMVERLVRAEIERVSRGRG